MGGTDLEFVNGYLQESAEKLAEFAQDKQYHDKLNRFGELMAGSIQAGGKLLLAGNGGSAGDAQHIAGEFISRLFVERSPLPAIALTTDTSVMTAVANDYGYVHVFERQLLGLGRKGDVFVGISTSGKSESILKALSTARSLGLKTVGLTGQNRNPMDEFCDEILHVPSNKTAIIQQLHIVAAHIFCGLVERRIVSAAD